MSDRLQPALWGGLFIGVLSALPFVNAGNCCCCLWVLVGGALAAYLRQQNNPYQIDAAEGAIVGLMAGAIGGVIYSILSIPLQMMVGPMQQQWMERMMSSNPDITPEMRDMVERMRLSSGVRLIGMIISVVVVLDLRAARRPDRRRPSSSGISRRLRRPERSTFLLRRSSRRRLRRLPPRRLRRRRRRWTCNSRGRAYSFSHSDPKFPL